MNNLTQPNSNFIFTPTCLSIKNPSYQEWVECGEWLKYVNSGVQWWIGDWLNYGEYRWGEVSFQQLNGDDYSQKTLHNLKYVAGKVEPSRRRETLTFSHHTEVASLDCEAQEAWLDRADKEQLSTRSLRSLISEQTGLPDYEGRLQQILVMIDRLATDWPECLERIKEHLE